MTVCVSSVARTSATSRVPMRGACLVVMVVILRVPASRIPVGLPHRGKIRHCQVGNPRARDVFQGRVNTGPQATDSVADTGGVARCFVVEIDKDAEIGDRVVTGADSSQGVAWSERYRR